MISGIQRLPEKSEAVLCPTKAARRMIMKNQNTKLSGDVSVENSYGDIDLELGEKDLEQLEITAKTEFGEIDVPDTMENLLRKEEDEQSFSYEPDQAAGRIKLMTQDGDISMEND